MAVLDSLPAVKAKIKVEGANIQEYKDPYASEEVAAPDNTVIKYIESMEDAEFTIHVKVDETYKWNPKYVFDVTVHIDGHDMGGIVLRQSHVNTKRSTNVRLVTCDERGQWRWQVYKFKSVTICKLKPIVTSCSKSSLHNAAEDQASAKVIKKQMVKAETMGTIEIRIRRAIMVGTRSLMRDRSSNPLSGSDLKMAEKALKGKDISHGSVYKSLQLIDSVLQNMVLTLVLYSCSVAGEFRGDFITLDYEGEDRDRPLAIFQFRYRSKGELGTNVP
jgi:hypothetical protein